MVRTALSRSFVASLKGCIKNKDLQAGAKLHSDIRNTGLLEKDLFLGNTLVSMYAKCGALDKAWQVFHELPTRDIVSWNALIAAYAQQGKGEEAMDCYQKMKSDGLSPDAFTYSCILKACAITKEVRRGKQFHDEIVSRGFLDKDIILGNALVDMYAKCSVLSKARQVLEELPTRNVVSWNALIAGYAQSGLGQEALDSFQRMRKEGHYPDAVTYACILKSCGITKKLDLGKQIHDDILSQGLLEKNVVLGNALVDMYAKCGLLTKAKHVVDELSDRDVVSWSVLISGYVQQGQGKEAIDCFDRMQSEGILPNAVTYVSFLKACGITKEGARGKPIHDNIVRQGLLGEDVVLGNALVDMYAKCGMPKKAQEVLDGLPMRSIVSWNALISGYAEEGMGNEVIYTFDRMCKEGCSPDAITYICILKACGLTQQRDTGKKIHDEIVSQGLLRRNPALGNALVDMYGKCGDLSTAQEVLDELSTRDVVTWSALVAGYMQQGRGQEAIASYLQMQSEGIAANSITYSCILKACGITKEVDRGKQIHDEIIDQGLLEKDPVLSNDLIDMYVKCGMLLRARQVLEELPTQNATSWSVLISEYANAGNNKQAVECFHQMQSKGITPNIVSWNALIRCYAQQGLSDEVLASFGRMEGEGIVPDGVTFLLVLKACSHAGLMDEGHGFFEDMRNKYGIAPTIEHLVSMIDLFGHAGRLDKAWSLIKEMKSSEYRPVWSALMSACQKWGNVKVGRLAFDHAVKADEDDAAVYVCMENMYMSAGMPEDAQTIRAMRLAVMSPSIKDGCPQV